MGSFQGVGSISLWDSKQLYQVQSTIMNYSTAAFIFGLNQPTVWIGSGCYFQLYSVH